MLGQHIADPRALSDELGDCEDMYAGLASYSFGAPRPSLSPAPADPPALPRLSPDRTPRPSVIVSSHPSHHPETSDTASQHTFGRAHAFASSSSVSVSTSRSSSRASMRTSEQFSSDEELDVDYYDDGHSSPVTFARYDLIDIDEDPDLDYPVSFRESRRGSFPIAIPGSDAHSREGSILTVRRPSRSLDDASVHRLSLADQDLILPKSEPNSRADWHSLEVQRHAIQQQQQQPEPQIQVSPYEGLDLQYILSKRSEGSIHSVGSRLSFIHGTAGPRKSSPQLFRGAGSTTTLPFEDTFMRHIQKHDRAYDALRFYWSFLREKADASTTSARRRQHAHHLPRKDAGLRVQEMWRCGHVGRFKVDKLVFKPQSADPAKGAQQRIHVRHIPDPFLMGGTTSGPHSVIHKHSRAVAFSIFRSHSLFSGRQPAGLGPTNQTHMNMRLGIMLAPKKVQEQYTSTKTTRQLSTHGLLDGDSRAHRRGTQSLPFRERESRDRTKKQAQTLSDGAKDKSQVKAKEKKYPHPESTGSSSAGSISAAAIKTVVAYAEQPAVRIQLSPSISSSTSISARDSASRSASPSSLLPLISPTDVPDSDTPPVRHHRDSIDSEDRVPTRTTHAEAFSALDPNDIETLRAKANSRVNADPGSLAERLFRVFRGSSKTDDHPSGTQPRAFQPPWLTTAGRDQQEENDRVLSDLNASFRDVGLLHTNPHRSSKSASKRRSNQGIFDQIPDDCLYMLLPLWPGETDPASAHPETGSTTSFVTIPENRRFLLVYYVPFEEVHPRHKKHEKKKAKHSHSSEGGAEPDSKKSIYLSTFRAVARVVTYDELRLSGVRVPSDGLAVSGPEWEAVTYACLPLRDAQMPDAVVCQCHSRDSGFDFLEDGLLSLGLCTREELPPQEHVPEWEEEERDGKLALLTPIGRAVVEMIWLGCLAITSFGAV